MAAITISAAGGNWNSTATWVGGVIPTTSDHIVGNASSGQLTVNVNATVQYHDFSAYTQTLTINNGINLQFSLASATNVYGASMNFTSGTTGLITYQGVASTLIQNTTNEIPNVQFNGGVTRTLNTNLYITNFNYVNAPTFNGNNVFISGNLIQTGVGNQNNFLRGNTIFNLQGNGITNVNIQCNLVVSGNYNTYGNGVLISNGANFTFTAGTIPNIFNLIAFKSIIATDTVTINCNRQVNLFLDTKNINSGFVNYTMNLTSPLNLNILGTYAQSRLETSDRDLANYIFNNAISATTLSLTPMLSTTQSTTNTPTGDFFDYTSLTLRLPTGYTHYFGSLELNGGTTTPKPIIRSATSGVKATLNLGSKITSQIINYDFTDINASGGQQIVAINGTISNSDNITNVYPTGGGGGGGSFTFVN